jgi:hypothetical protein
MGLYSRIAGLLSGPVQWISSVVAPGFSQAAAVSGAGANITIAPQAATTTGASGSLVINYAAPASGTVEAGLYISRAGTALFSFSNFPAQPGTALFGMGGCNIFTSGTGFGGTGSWNLNASGGITLQTGGLSNTFTTTLFSIAVPIGGISTIPFSFANAAVTLATSGTTSLSAAQQTKPNLTIAAVTLTGAGLLDFGNVTGNYQVNILGVNAASFATFGLSFKNGTTTTALPSTALTNGGLVIVRCDPNLLAFCA